MDERQDEADGDESLAPSPERHEASGALPTAAPPPEGDAPMMPAGRAIAVVLVTLVLAAILDAEGLHQAAKRLDYGTTRDVAVSVTGGLARTTAFFGLDRPRDWAMGALGHETSRPTKGGPSLLAGPPTAPPSPPDDPDAPATTSTTVGVRARDVPTVLEPLRVWFGGDSMAAELSDGFGRLTASDSRIDLRTDAQVSTGLARADVFDWAAHLHEQLATHDPDVVILVFGANDDQSLETADGFVALGTDAWKKEYRRRVATMLDVAGVTGRTVVWVGLPEVVPDRLNAAKEVMNAVAKEEVATREHAVYVDPGEVLELDGRFATYLPTPDGRGVKVRLKDGVHVTTDGANLVAPVILDAFAQEWGLTGTPPSP